MEESKALEELNEEELAKNEQFICEFTDEVFPNIWKRVKVEVKGLSKKDAALIMFQLGASAMHSYFIEMAQALKDKKAYKEHTSE